MPLPITSETLSLARAIRKTASSAPPPEAPAAAAYPFAALFSPPACPVEKTASAEGSAAVTLPLWAVALYRDEEALEKAAADVGGALRGLASTLCRTGRRPQHLQNAMGRFARMLEPMGYQASKVSPAAGAMAGPGRGSWTPRKGFLGALARGGIGAADWASKNAPGMACNAGKGLSGLMKGMGEGHFRQPGIQSLVQDATGKKHKSVIRGVSPLHQWFTGKKQPVPEPPDWFQPNG